jgi:hypothetical protein
MSCGMSHGMGSVPQSMVSRTPVFDNGHRQRKTILSRKAGVYRPTKKHKKPKFL